MYIFECNNCGKLSKSDSYSCPPSDWSNVCRGRADGGHHGYIRIAEEGSEKWTSSSCGLTVYSNGEPDFTTRCHHSWHREN